MRFSILMTMVISIAFGCSQAIAAPKTTLFVGVAETDITPDKLIGLGGHMSLIFPEKIETPVTANVVVLESRQGDKVLDSAVMVSCDLVATTRVLTQMVREAVAKRIPELDTQKIFLNPTHTHTGPCLRFGFHITPPGVMSAEEYVVFLAKRITDAVEKAWKARKPCGVSWGLGHAVVAYNRRIVYADGSSVMYGDVKKDTFRKIEGPEDHGVEMLFFWDENEKLIATIINVACPSQEYEMRHAINADFWHPVREQLKKKHGKDLCVLAWCGAGGDQSPHFERRSSVRSKAEVRMQELRGLSQVEELGRRIVATVNDVCDVVKKDIRHDVPLVHVVKNIELPMRLVTKQECDDSRAGLAKVKKGDKYNRRRKWYQDVIDRYENQKVNPKPTREMELHVLRLGDVAIATNSFELFTDFGTQIKARSKATQTFIIQLVGSGCFYLPTEEATRGGGYSAIVQSVEVGPQGGQILVEKTVNEINRLWKSKK